MQEQTNGYSSSPAKTNNENEGKTELFIGNLNFDTTEDSLRAFFEPYGELVKCKLLRGKAFVEYTDSAAA